MRETETEGRDAGTPNFLLRSQGARAFSIEMMHEEKTQSKLSDLSQQYGQLLWQGSANIGFLTSQTLKVSRRIVKHGVSSLPLEGWGGGRYLRQ